MYRHVLQATHVCAWSHPSKHCQEFQQIRQFSTDFKELWSQIYTQTHEFIDMATLNFDHEDDQDQLLSQALYVNENEIDDGEDEHLAPASGEEYLRKVVKERKKYEVIETGESDLKKNALAS